MVQGRGKVDTISASNVHISLAPFLGLGLYLLRDVIDAIRANDRYGSALAFFVVVGLPILAMAIFGIRNVLRFPKEGEEHPDQLR
jgi:hypothetical protein